MDPLTLTLQIINTALAITQTVINDQPPEMRRQLWADFYQWTKDIKAMGQPKT